MRAPPGCVDGVRFRYGGPVRLIVARCQVDYAGRLSAHLPLATRLILAKADGSVSIHADDRAYKPLNWMNPPCTLTIGTPEEGSGFTELWEIRNKDSDTLVISIAEVLHDSSHELGRRPRPGEGRCGSAPAGAVGRAPGAFGAGWTLVQREYLTPIGPVDLLFRDERGGYVAVEMKRRGEIDGVEQLTRYLALMNTDRCCVR